MPFLEVNNLSVRFDIRDGVRHRYLYAVNGVSFGLAHAESLGLVGESGSGKTTLGRAVLGLIPTSGGEVLYEGRPLDAMLGGERDVLRRMAQMVFQDPFDSLNPRLSIGSAIGEGLAIHRLVPRDGRGARVAALLKMVGLDPEYATRYPHEFSGGQRQRIGIARALATGPQLIVADEPVSALDVSVQAQILKLMKDLQQQMGLAYLFIAHDLAVVRHMCDRVMVMYLGRIVESAPAADLFAQPAHPYTHALLSAVPDIDKGLRMRMSEGRRIVLKGDVPSPISMPSGCPFHPRCPCAEDICRSDVPPVREISPGHTSVCHFADRVAARGIGAMASP